MMLCGPSDSPQDVGQLLYTSLLILGLDAQGLEHKLKTPVNQKIFSRINKRLGDTILHFLFVCLDREKAAKVFRDCWPLLDKKHEAQFHKATFEWYKSLQQSYRQPVPTVMAKTFMAPGGPRFFSTLMALARMALHISIAKKAPGYTLLHAPSYSRKPYQNQQTLQILQAFKMSHCQNYCVKQRIRQNVLTKLQNTAKELCVKYRRLCREGEKTAQQLKEALAADQRLSQHQRERFASASLSAIQKDILDDISKMNHGVDRTWGPLEQFRQIEESSWRVMSPMLDGSTSLSHISGSLYSPQVPEIVYKAHASTINKLGLQGLYCEGKLNLLSLVQYTSLALTCLLDVARTTYRQARPESSDKLKAQCGQVTSLSETVSQLKDRLYTLLPELTHSMTSYHLRSGSGFPALERNGLERKPHLCPPTPPLSLVNTPVDIRSRMSHIPLYLTPGTQHPTQCLPEDGLSMTPSKLLYRQGMIRAARKSPKADVNYSTATCRDDSILVNESAMQEVLEAGLTVEMVTVDLHGQYLRKKEQSFLQDTYASKRKQKGYGCSIFKKYHNGENSKQIVKSVADLTELRMKESHEKEETNITDHEKCSDGVLQDTNGSLIEKVAVEIAREMNNEYDDDSGATELHTTQGCNDTGHSYSTLDSGCVEASGDFDTLMDAIQDMNITPRPEKLKSSENYILYKVSQTPNRKSSVLSQGRSTKVSLVSSDTPKKCNVNPSAQVQPQLGDAQDITTSTFGGCNPSANKKSNPSFRNHLDNQNQGGETSLCNIEQNCLASQDSRGSVFKWDTHSPIDLQEKLSYITQSPIRNNCSPVAARIPSKFDGLDISPASTVIKSQIPSKTSGGENPVDELKTRSKANLDLLLELQKSSLTKMSPNGSAKTSASKPSFLSYVENLKKNQSSIRTKKNVMQKETNTEQENSVAMNVTQKEKITEQGNSADSRTKSTLVDTCFDDNISEDYYKSFSRMQSLLNIDLSKHSKDCQESEEVFVSPQDMARHFEAHRQQSFYLPEASVFDTLTDSILAGETDVCLLTNEDIKVEIRRESISSRRQSIAKTRRFSLESTKHLSEPTAFLPENCSGILDESDSCLLSTSVENI